MVLHVLHIELILIFLEEKNSQGIDMCFCASISLPLGGRACSMMTSSACKLTNVVSDPSKSS